ncbi:Averufin oxidase A [Colletotrichum chlorophyti]|uniref:Averufin oxidase A n=1 Tax=Colletotrichum chlorophyti TaxID=708187 RepID=A0A1Q8S937_9PEZI|nr:Averufin oxidase A [Colletotrichum chlorophyti]
MPSESTTSKRTLAIFGATGRTGSETLKNILAKHINPLYLKIYVRSRSRLLSKFPELKTSRTAEIFEGQITDVEAVKSCLAGADTFICALGDNGNRPGIRVMEDASRTIVTALRQLKAEAGNSWEKPRLILLSSATWNDRFTAHRPAAVHWMVANAFFYTYTDLRGAHAVFKSEPELMKLLLVQPPAIIEEEASGYTISVETVGLAVSYADLGAAFAELATEPAYESVDAVGVTSGLSKEGFPRYGREIMTRVVRGLLATFVPGFWRINDMLDRVLG